MAGTCDEASRPACCSLAAGFGLLLPLRLSATAAPDEILQGRLIDLVAFVDVDGAPDIPVEAGVE